MTAKIGVTITKDEVKKVLDNLKAMTDKKVLVGISGDEDQRE